MNPVRNQGGCGSCWAFAAVATTEGKYAIKYGSKVLLSEQQLVDCTRDCYGCDGGWIDRGLNFIRYNGAMSQTSYPYTESQTDCKNSVDTVIARVNDVFTRRSTSYDDKIHAIILVF
jgi:C1A family cysteine protease